MKALKVRPFIGDTRKDVLEYYDRVKKTVTEHCITAGKIRYLFDKNGIVTSVERKCRKCQAIFTVGKVRYILDWCPGCRKKYRTPDTGTKSPYCEQSFRQPAVAKRACLMCGRLFVSQGSHNRRCSKCSEKVGKLRDNILIYKDGLLRETVNNLN